MIIEIKNPNFRNFLKNLVYLLLIHNSWDKHSDQFLFIINNVYVN